MTPTSTRRRRTKVRRTRGRRTGIVLGWVLLVCVALVAVAGVWTAVDALRVRDQLVEAASVVPQLEDQVLAGDDEAVASSVATLRDAAFSAVATTERPHWTLTSWLPGVGPNVRAVRTLAGTVSDLAEGPLPSLPAVVAAASPAALAPQDGRVDVQSVAEAAPVVVAADDGVNAAIDALAAIDRSALLPQVSDAVDQLSNELEDLKLSTATASRAVQLIPPMMGIDGPRDYLVLVQNNAEPRALGGIVGSVLVLRADGGSIELVEQVAGNSIYFDSPAVQLSDSERALYGSQLGRFMVNATSTPDFRRAAEIASGMWVASGRTAPDGVISIDPLVLQGLLMATGPLETSRGYVLTEENAAQILLNQIYLDEPDPLLQDTFFAEASRQMFDAITSGTTEPSLAVDSLALSASEGRLLIWSRDQLEQQLLADTVLSGTPSVGDAEVGVFFNDGSGAKVGYFLDRVVESELVECRPDGSQKIDLTVRLASKIASGQALPPYLSGGGQFVPIGAIRTNIAVYAPPGASIDGVSMPGDELSVMSQVSESSPVSQVTVTLVPEESVEISFRIITAARTVGGVSVRQTPGPAPLGAPAVTECPAG